MRAVGRAGFGRSAFCFRTCAGLSGARVSSARDAGVTRRAGFDVSPPRSCGVRLDQAEAACSRARRPGLRGYDAIEKRFAMRVDRNAV